MYVGYNLAAPLTSVYFNPQTRVNGGQCSDGSCNHKSICLRPPPVMILEGSTAGYRCTALTMINTAAECQAAASALGLTWRGVSTGAHYQDGCSVYVGYNLVAPLTNVWFNPRTRVNGGQCVHTNGDTSDGSCNHKSICH